MRHETKKTALKERVRRREEIEVGGGLRLIGIA